MVTRYSTDIRNKMWWAVQMCVLQIFSGMFLPKILQNRTKSDRDIEGWTFFRHSV